MTAYQTRPRQQRSITSHRLFPPLVALWFGALFGLSSLAVRTELFETMVIASGFDRLFPAASPPLGHTARLLIALVFGVIGGGLGHFVARLVAGHGRPSTYGDAFYPPAGAPTPTPTHDDYRVRARDAHPDAPARRPISAHTELGDESFVAGGAPASDWPASDWPASDWGADAFPASGWQDTACVAPIAAEPDPPMPAWFQPNAPVAVPVFVAKLAPEVLAPMAYPEPDRVPEPASAPESAPAPTEPALPPAWRNTAERIVQVPPAALSQVELIERLAITLQHRQDQGSATPEPADDPSECATPADDAGDQLPHPGPHPGTPEAVATIQALRDALSSLRSS